MSVTQPRPSGAPPAEIVDIRPDPWTEPFWLSAREHRLVACRCVDCRRFRMPPTPFCPGCLSQQVEWPQLCGAATVYSFTIVRHAVIPELAHSVPFVVALVELDDAPGARLFTNLVDCDPEAVHIGQPVRVVWDRVSDAVTIPRFTPTET